MITDNAVQVFLNTTLHSALHSAIIPSDGYHIEMCRYTIIRCSYDFGMRICFGRVIMAGEDVSFSWTIMEDTKKEELTDYVHHALYNSIQRMVAEMKERFKNLGAMAIAYNPLNEVEV
jgi:hypothetical protein